MRRRPHPSTDRVFTAPFVRLAGVSFCVLLSAGILTPIIPRYVEGPLGGGGLAVGLAVGAFNAAAVVVRPPLGRVADRRGRRVLFVAGPALMSAAVAAHLTGPSLGPLMALRGVQGLGEAAFFVGAVTSVADMAPVTRRAEAISYFSVSVFLGLGAGPAIGETLQRTWGFAAVWTVAALVAGAGAVIGTTVPDTRTVVGDTAPAPLVHRAALWPGAVMCLGIIGLSGFNAFVPLYAPAVGLGATGPLFALYSAVVLTGRIVAARLPDRIGYHRAARIAMSSSACGLSVIALVRSPAGLVAGTVLLGCGISLQWPALSSLVVAQTPDRERGSAMATFTAFFDLGQGAGATSLGAVATVAGYPGVFAFAAVSAATGAVLVGTLRSPRDQQTGVDHGEGGDGGADRQAAGDRRVDRRPDTHERPSGEHGGGDEQHADRRERQHAEGEQAAGREGAERDADTRVGGDGADHDGQ